MDFATVIGYISRGNRDRLGKYHGIGRARRALIKWQNKCEEPNFAVCSANWTAASTLNKAA